MDDGKASKKKQQKAICTTGCNVCASSQDLSLLARSTLRLKPAATGKSLAAAAPTPFHEVPLSDDHQQQQHQAEAAADAQPCEREATGDSAHARDGMDAEKSTSVVDGTSAVDGSGAVDATGSVDGTGAAAAAGERSQPAGEDAGEVLVDDALPGWRTVQGRFHSVGGAVISCRNDKAPDGVATHAHLADGNLELIMIKECSRPQYLHQLLCLAWKGADPLNFNFVEHRKTPAFTFQALGGQAGHWNVDGELVEASELSAQVFRGLVDVFAAGPIE
eukprot:TRINITY_DN11379_c0_g2_i1.p1 TRINITY_DN11379_c0_g2~~TRINITY_DN11379_c0_g2_i1.p1  ORF type:complete len:284 (-),score=34.62 TRINITY_DN11379_c0_g2_i1:295-1122(-)